MTTARSSKIDLELTPFYLCTTRCVRRSFLCGIDSQTGKDYNHRREWIIDRLKELTDCFAIMVASYAIMSNHYHTVLYIDIEKAKSWSDEEVIDRWAKIFPNDANEFVEMNLPPQLIEAKIQSWRERLMSISWFMRCLNEIIARRANKEDECTGRFWEGRFKSQALLDEGAILSAMAYVDLNPVRANAAATPEESEFTSIFERIKSIQQIPDSPIAEKELKKAIDASKQPDKLMRFSCKTNNDDTPEIPFLLSDYLELVDDTGRILRDDKPGAISNHLLPILSRLQLKPQGWLNMIKNLETIFCNAIGNVSGLSTFSQRRKSKSRGFHSACQCYYAKAA